MRKVVVHNYPIKVWTTSISLTPIILMLILAFQEQVNWNIGLISLYILTVFAEVIFGLPSVLLYTVAFKELVLNIKSAMLLKTVLSFIAIATLGFTYAVVENGTHSGYENDIIIPLFCFISTVVLSGYVFRTEKRIPIEIQP